MIGLRTNACKLSMGDASGPATVGRGFVRRVLAFAAVTGICGCTLLGGRQDMFVMQDLTGRAEQILADMSVEDKVAQMVIVELEGKVLPSDTDRRLIGLHGAGGAILPAFSTVPHTAEYVKWIAKAAARHPKGIAPFVICDDPSGLGGRLPYPATSFPRPMALAAGSDTDTVREVAALAAEEMRALGVTMVLGPRADVCDRADRPMVSLNCFGSEPDLVADMVTATISGYREHGVLAVPGRFPGMGCCDRPPFVGTPIVVKPAITFERDDLMPFKRVVQEGCDAILAGHAVVPTVDPSIVPASMSSYFLTDLLRDKWSYDGLVIADALNQQAVSNRFSPAEASVRAIQAGADMIVWRTGYSRYMATMQVLCDAVVNRNVSLDKINRSVLRILRAKEAYGLLAPEYFASQPNERNVGSRQARKAAVSAVRQGVTILKNDGELLPIDTQSAPRIGIVTLVGSDSIVPMVERFKVGVRSTECYSARFRKWNPDSAVIDRAVRMGSESDVVLVTLVPVDGQIPYGQEELLVRLARVGVPVVALVLGVPIDLTSDKTIRAAVATYTFGAGDRINISSLQAAVDCVFGRAAVRLVEQHDRRATAGVPFEMDLRSMSISPPGKLPLRVSGSLPSQRTERYFPVGMAKRVKWDFGDGEKARGVSVIHTYEMAGTYTVKVTCRDVYDEESSMELDVIVRGAEPDIS